MNPLKAMLNMDHPLMTKGYNSVLAYHFIDFVQRVQQAAIDENIAEKIHINIWDDFHDDGHVPEGEVQKTYIYVEENDEDFDQDTKKKILEKLIDHILDIHKETNVFEGVSMELKFYDSREKYPDIKDSEHPGFHFSRWEIRLENITHEKLDNLMEHLSEHNYFYERKYMHIYSES